jgi:hypothetical protein
MFRRDGIGDFPRGGAALWSLPSRRAVGGPCAAESLEDSHLGGRSAAVWHESATDNRRLKTGKKFLAYVEQCLAPTLKPKDIVMIDNLPAHKAIGPRGDRRSQLIKCLPVGGRHFPSRSESRVHCQLDK